MINILVDECYAFDYLSILEVKKNVDQTKNFKQWKECFDYLKNQIPSIFDQAISSPEYNDLYKSNLRTFDAVAKARSGGNITAKEVDDCNMERYNSKMAFQAKFFPNAIIREIKL